SICVALGCSLRLPRRLIHLYGAINLVFERLKIVRWNLICHLFDRIQSHDCTLPRKDFWNFLAVYSTFLWTSHPIGRPHRGSAGAPIWLIISAATGSNQGGRKR